MSDIKIDKRGDRFSVFMKPWNQLHRREYTEEDKQHFAELMHNKKSEDKTEPSFQPEEAEKNLSQQEPLKAIMGSLTKFFPQEKLEWRSLDKTQTRLAIKAPEAIADGPEKIRVRIENTVLNGCELHLSGTLKKLNAELLIKSKEQFYLIKKIQEQFIGYLRQALPHTQVYFYLRMIDK